MAPTLNPYLVLDGTCRQAMEFYQSVLGGELDISTFGESGVPGVDPDGIMHAQLTTADGHVIMGSDTGGMALQPGDTVGMSLSGDDALLADVFAKLSDGGQVVVPFERQMWGDDYGQVRDRFGVVWHVNRTGGAA